MDTYGILWLYQHLVGERAQNIGKGLGEANNWTLKLKLLSYNFFKGVWLHIMQFLNLVAIINQSFLTAFTSQWSKSYYTNDNTLDRFIYVVVFEVEDFF